MNSGRVAAGGARARGLAEEDDEEGAHGERRCGRAARNHKLSAHLRIADDVYYKDHSSLPLICLVRAHELAVQSVLEREFGKCLFSLPFICM